VTAPESATRLQLLSAGAAQGIVGSVADEFRAETGAIVEGTFGAVGDGTDDSLRSACGKKLEPRCGLGRGHWSAFAPEIFTMRSHLTMSSFK